MIDRIPLGAPMGMPVPSAGGPSETKPAGTRTFGEMLKDAINQAEATQQRADQEAMKLVSGEAENLHDVVIAAEEASLMLTLAVQMRNRAVEAYQELMRTQI